MEITVNTKTRKYPIYFERGALFKTKELIGNEGHVFLISEDGVPEKWRDILQNQYPDAPMYIFHQGEASKNINTWQDILKSMLENHLSRKDIVIALGGGVTGDMAGFASATYMRGIDYVNIPTTSLSQIDSSIGGKTAIDYIGYKNCVGAFWQPKAVIVDPNILETLSERQLNNGLAEAIKEGLTFQPELFEIFEKDDYKEHIDEIIYKCLCIKKEVVEHDEKETGERKLLNFGHTIGHAIESYYGMDKYLHGECVGMGMMAIMTNENLKQRLQKVLERLSLPIKTDFDVKEVLELIKSDKKANHDYVTIVQVDEMGKGYLEDWTIEQIERKLENE